MTAPGTTFPMTSFDVRTRKLTPTGSRRSVSMNVVRGLTGERVGDLECSGEYAIVPPGMPAPHPDDRGDGGLRGERGERGDVDRIVACGCGPSVEAVCGTGSSGIPMVCDASAANRDLLVTRRSSDGSPRPRVVRSSPEYVLASSGGSSVLEAAAAFEGEDAAPVVPAAKPTPRLAPAAGGDAGSTNPTFSPPAVGALGDPGASVRDDRESPRADDSSRRSA